MYLIRPFVFPAQPPCIEVITQQLQLNSGLEVVIQNEQQDDIKYYGAQIGFACAKERLNIRIEKQSSTIWISGSVANNQLVERLALVLTAMGGLPAHPDRVNRPASAADTAYSQPISAQQLQASERRTSRQLMALTPLIVLWMLVSLPVSLAIITWKELTGRNNSV